MGIGVQLAPRVSNKYIKRRGPLNSLPTSNANSLNPVPA